MALDKMSDAILDQLADIIKKNKGMRKLVFRWKDNDIENYLKTHHGLEADFYVSVGRSRIDNKTTFNDSILVGHGDKYLICIMPGLPWNPRDEKKYTDMGFENGKDIIWFNQQDKIKDNALANEKKPFLYSDDLGNHIEAFSKSNFRFKGCNARIKIGKNVRLPSYPIDVYDNAIIDMGDNVNITSPRFEIKKESQLIVGNDTSIRMSMVINNLSHVKIGNNSGLNTGQLRTGRNQEIIVGDDCIFSWDVVFMGHDGHIIWDINTQKPLNNTTGSRRQSIVIGNHVWFGGEVILLPGTKVGDGCILGYRSMLKGIYPNNCIIAGSIAKVIKKNIAWNRSNYSRDDSDFFNIKEGYRNKTKETD